MFEFLQKLSKIYEIVIFTAGIKEYADFILDRIDPNKLFIKHRLYRQHCQTVVKKDGSLSFCKNLELLGRDLRKTIIIDNIKENFVLQRENGIFIDTWTDNEKDTMLKDLIPLLSNIHKMKIADVRTALQNYRDSVMRILVKQSSQTTSGDIEVLVDRPITDYSFVTSTTVEQPKCSRTA